MRKRNGVIGGLQKRKFNEEINRVQGPVYFAFCNASPDYQQSLGEGNDGLGGVGCCETAGNSRHLYFSRFRIEEESIRKLMVVSASVIHS